VLRQENCCGSVPAACAIYLECERRETVWREKEISHGAGEEAGSHATTGPRPRAHPRRVARAPYADPVACECRKPHRPPRGGVGARLPFRLLVAVYLHGAHTHKEHTQSTNDRSRHAPVRAAYLSGATGRPCIVQWSRTVGGGLGRPPGGRSPMYKNVSCTCVRRYQFITLGGWMTRSSGHPNKKQFDQ